MSSLTNLIHIAFYNPPGGRVRSLLLRKISPHTFTWYENRPNQTEAETSVTAPNIEEALRLAHRHWKNDSFRTLICGFRYTLPERDEHGMNALFYQMVASLSSMNGIYFDEELGSNCIVHNASLEARNLWDQLKTNEKTR